MSVLNWIVSQFDYLFFIQGVPVTPIVTAKTTTTTKHLRKWLSFRWSILQFTPESCRQWQSEWSWAWETKDSSFIEQVRDHFLLSYPWMNSQSLFCEFIAWYRTTINDQHIHLLSGSWPFVPNNICISTGTKIWQNASILKDKNRNMSSLFSNALILIKCSITVA